MDNLAPSSSRYSRSPWLPPFGTRTAIGLSVTPGLAAAGAVVYSIAHAPKAERRDRQPLRLRLRPLLDAGLGPLLVAIVAFEVGNVNATLLIILRASEHLGAGRSEDRATQLAVGLYIAYNVAATIASGSRRAPRRPSRPRPDLRRGRRTVRTLLCRAGHRRGHRHRPRPRLCGRWCGRRLRRGRRTCRHRRRRSRTGPRLCLRVPARHPELRQPRRQRRRRCSLDRRVANDGVHLPRRLDGDRAAAIPAGQGERDRSPPPISAFTSLPSRRLAAWWPKAALRETRLRLAARKVERCPCTSIYG